MQVTVERPGGAIEFHCDEGYTSAWVSKAILSGRQYPHVDVADDVRVVVDVGANCGAASVYFADLYPDATVHAVEPGSTARGYLERNAVGRDIVVHPVGLHSTDSDATLHLAEDLGSSSIFDRGDGPTEPITLRHAGAWAAEHGIDRIDILKVDVEGCELEVLTALSDLLPTVQVVHFEYDHRRTRRDIDRLLDPSHELLFAPLTTLDQGEATYVRADLADRCADLVKRLLLASLTPPPGVGAGAPEQGSQLGPGA